MMREHQAFVMEVRVARPRNTSLPQLTPGQADYVLQRLISDRRVSAGDVTRYVSDMQREIDELQRRLETLRAASSSAFGRPARARRGAGRRRRPLSAERRASQQLQGRYLGLIRQIPANRRAQYRKIAKAKGREAAIKEMASALGK
jgi:hypothetical protein